MYKRQRQVVFQRLSEVTYPTGVTPTLAPLASPSGLVYRYVIDSPDRTPQELKVYEDWVIEREYKPVSYTHLDVYKRQQLGESIRSTG